MNFYKKMIKRLMTLFIIPNKGHTLGNIIRYELLKDENVLIAAYKVTHPLKEELQLYIKSCSKEMNVNEKDIINNAIDSLRNKIKNLEKLVKHSFDAKHLEA